MSAGHGIYSQVKALAHPGRLAALASGGHPAPVYLQLYPTNRCNFHCRWCAFRMPGYSSNEIFAEQDEIPLVKLYEIIADCEDMGIRAIEVTGGGDPMMHANHAGLFRAIIDSGIELGIVTNGMILRSDALAEIMRARWIRISTDAGLEWTYAALKDVPPSLFRFARENLRRLVERRRQANQTEPTIGVGFVVTADNWQEVLQATLNAREDGADNIRIGAMFGNEGTAYFNGFRQQAQDLCAAARELSTPSFMVYDLFSGRMDQLQQGPPEFATCWHQRLAVIIGADLNVYRCCVMAYNRIGLIGSLVNRRFRDFWADPTTKRNMEQFDARSCPRCIRAESNTAIAAYVRGEVCPKTTDHGVVHENFL